MRGDILAIIPLVGVTLLVLWSIILTVLYVRFRRAQRRIMRTGEGGDIVSTLDSCLSRIGQLDAEIKSLRKGQGHLGTVLDGAVQRVGVVRFDAFDDIGGRLSFAVALLSEEGNGVVISSINGRQESRSYAKPVAAGNSSYNLSAEERDAITQAMAAKRKSAG